MEEWKVRQDVYHRLNRDHSDDLNNKELIISDTVVQDAIDYFYKNDMPWIYPAKSYMVAICYARWLAEEFGGRAVEYLDDPDLLYGNDPYFCEYSRDPKTYHQILNIVGWDFDETQGMCPDVKGYFKEEFMI